MKAKSIILIAIACLLAPWLFWSGLQDYQNARRLADHGQEASAQVLDHITRSGTRGANRYYLSVKFQTASGQALTRRVQVNRNQYVEAHDGNTVTLRYLAANPGVCSIGEPVATWRGLWTRALFMLTSGAMLAFAIWRWRRAAGNIAGRVGTLCQSKYEYACVNATDFPHLDLAWYDATRRWLHAQGFVFLADEENITFRRANKGPRVLLRTMLGQEGTWLAYLYHFKPASRTHVEGFKILELQTRFSNRAFLTTSNAEASGKLDSPPGVDALRLPANTPFEAIVAAHGQRVAACLAANPDVAAMPMATLEDIHRAQNVLQGIKAAYRRNVGITRAELQRLAGARLDSAQITELHKDVVRLHAEQNQKAA